MKRNNILSFMVSADWHIGATDPYRFRKELIETIKPEILKRKALDMFIIAGDTFDMKEYLSSDSVKVFFLIMADILELTKPFHTQIRILEGTRTHDALQLSTLRVVFENLLQNNRVKFIEELSSENIFDVDILYIPEEYVVNQELYYQDSFSKHYDFIFGHGNTDVMWFQKKNTKHIGSSSAPAFSADKLTEISHYSYFGHYHYNISAGYNGRFKSIGPVTRWEFGKDDRCGLYYVQYDKTTNLAIEDYIENIYAPILTTLIMKITENYDLGKLNEKIKAKIAPVKDKSDKVRLIIHMDSSLDTFVMMRDFLLSSYGNTENLTLIIKPIESNQTEETSIEDVTEVIDDKPYLYDKSMHDEARIASFIRKKEGVNISLENILNVIQKKDTKIKNLED